MVTTTVIAGILGFGVLGAIGFMYAAGCTLVFGDSWEAIWLLTCPF